MRYFLVEQVLIPKGAYNGQKLIKLVRIKTTANVISTIPHVPLTVSVKNRVVKIAASTSRMMRSEEPMFAFIKELLFWQTCHFNGFCEVTFVTSV
jgi:hypothetical protein